MKGKINTKGVGQKIDKKVVERMEKDMQTEDVYIRSKKDGKVFRAKSLYAKSLIKQNKARFVITVEKAKGLGIGVMDMDKLIEYDVLKNKIVI